MNTTKRIRRTVAVVALATGAALATASAAQAQLANASAATLGKGGNATATARGIEALSVNPAGLGMPGSGFTLALMPVQARSGLDPLTLADFKDVEGSVISAATKQDWLSRVTEAGGQSGNVGIDVTELALSLGRFGIQVSTLVGGEMSLAPGMVEAALYGNAGRTGSAEDLSFSGASASGFAVTTAGLSFALPIPQPTGEMAVGATLKYSVGHVVGIAQDRGGTFTSDPIRVDVSFPVVHTDDARLEDGNVNNGTGVGVDIGFMLKRGNISVGAAVLNAVNTFAWDESTLVYRPGTASLSIDDNETDFDAMSYGSAPADLKAAVEDLTFNPTISVGAALDLTEDFTVGADVRKRTGEGGMAVGPDFHAGVGAEFRGLKVLHLRGGAAVITDGVQFGGGASLVLGPVNISAAGALQTGDLGEALLGQFTLSFGGR